MSQPLANIVHNFTEPRSIEEAMSFISEVKNSYTVVFCGTSFLVRDAMENSMKVAGIKVGKAIDFGGVINSGKITSTVGVVACNVYLVPLSISSIFSIGNVLFVPLDNVMIQRSALGVIVPSNAAVPRTKNTIIPSDDIRVSHIKSALQKINSLEIGKYVVHRDYGVGLLEGIKIVQVGGQSCECVQIVYGDGKLYVPVDRIYLLSKYSGNDSVNTLKSARWEKAKCIAKSKIDEASQKIIELAAIRKTIKANIFDVNTIAEEIDELSMSFAYKETRDQLEALRCIYDDLAKGMPMDRLICGDVGVGKTEVATRAAFVVCCKRDAIFKSTKLPSNYDDCNVIDLGHTSGCDKSRMDSFNDKDNGQDEAFVGIKATNAQVAFLCPTVFLAEQHFDAMSSRFRRFGINVALMVSNNRTMHPKIQAGLASGEIDLVIGTHSLLKDDIVFKNLGLVICDEEQTFGVEQKDKLRYAYKGVHFLSLSATPIPRTLYRAICGIQDISLINTPPVCRREIKTEIIKFSKEKVAEIINTEKINGGQAIVVTPRIADIEDELLARFSALVPIEKIAILHGKMTPKELGKIKKNLFNGEYDLIIATTIIAVGIDFPINNTIIINRPEMFGISQLHQIRGRVGRRDKQAYCYFLVTERVMQDKEQMYRLEELKGLSGFGASLQIAHSDMERRGGGNLLNKAQSGHMEDISVHLYYDMLEESMNRLNKGAEIGISVPEINIDMPIYIPETYTRDFKERMELYRRISDISNAHELALFKIELLNKFGVNALQSIINLDEIVALRELCKKYYIASITKVKNRLVIIPANKAKWNIAKIFEMINSGASIAISAIGEVQDGTSSNAIEIFLNSSVGNNNAIKFSDNGKSAGGSNSWKGINCANSCKSKSITNSQEQSSVLLFNEIIAIELNKLMFQICND